jgi:hypothetical protein
VANHSERRRDAPRISVNKLGEYLTATPARRRRIIYDQKHPPTFQVIRYRDAERAIVEYLVGGQDLKVLEKARTRLAATVPESEFEAQTVHLCAEALEAFEDSLDALDVLDAVTVVPGQSDPEQMEFSGVYVSVRPEIVLVRPDRADPRVGCLKLYFGKTGPLDDRSGPYVSTVLAAFAEKHLASKGRVGNRLVVTLDVFARKVVVAPKARARRLDDVAAACEEIAARWGSV